MKTDVKNIRGFEPLSSFGTLLEIECVSTEVSAMKLTLTTIFTLLCVGFLASESEAVRIKDIATFSGVRTNQLVGYGLVVGLSGTGDSDDAPFTSTSLINMMANMGVAVDPDLLDAQNVASVMVTADLPATASAGSPLDVTLSSIGDAESLYGGVLLQTALKGIDGNVYAIAQGALIVGGYSFGGEAATVQQNTATVATIPGGATVEREVPFEFNSQQDLTLHMNLADFSTTQQVVERLNASMGGNYASAEDIRTVNIQIPEPYRGNLVPLLASIENLEITPESVARVVVDERTGTIVIGRDVRVAKVAIAHGNLQVVIQETTQVSQPGPFSQGQTVATPETDLAVREEQRTLNMVEGATLQELVDGLNAVGATPRDLISILRSLKASGALYAELEVI